MSEIRTFEELEAWQKCRAFRRFAFHRIIPELLERKEFDLANQLKRSSRSITNNIAEGYGRFHFRDNYKFCSNARASLFESLDHLICAHDEGLLSDDILDEGRDLFDEALKLLNGYMAYLKRSAEAPSNQ